MSLLRFIVPGLIALGFGFILIWSNQEPLDETLSNDTQRAPLAFAKQVTRYGFNEQGEVQNIIFAQSLDQPHDGKTIDFVMPIIKVEDGQNPAWEISSDFAVLEEQRVITLFDNVLVKNLVEPLSTDQNWNLTTNKLTYDDSKEYAYTDQAVKMTRSDSVLTATGMELDMRRETIEFKQDLNANYQP